MRYLAESTILTGSRACPRVRFAALLGILAVGACGWSATNPTAPAVPQMLSLTGDLAVHDPVIIRENDTFYVFSTGNRRAGILPIRRSKDLYHWTRCGSVFDVLPEWEKYA